MDKCDVLVANEGGTVHIAKALNKPTFTIFSPYVNKDQGRQFRGRKISSFSSFTRNKTKPI
jgi:heptosyltransferase-2